MNIVYLFICQRSHGVTLCQVLMVQFQGGFVLFSPQKVRCLDWEWVEFLPSIHQILGLILNTPCSRYDSTCQQSQYLREVETGDSKVQGHPQLQVRAQTAGCFYSALTCFQIFTLHLVTSAFAP